MNLKSLKAACIQAVGKDEAYALARSIATELTTESDRYTLAHKLVWQTLHAQLFDPTACLPSSHRVANQAEKISFSEICSTVEKEQNPFLAMLLVTVWLFAQWVSLLVWLTPRAIRLGKITRLYVIALASSYTTLSYRIVHGTVFPDDLSTSVSDCNRVGLALSKAPEAITAFLNKCPKARCLIGFQERESLKSNILKASWHASVFPLF